MKKCQLEKCSYNVFSKGYCKIHQYLRTDPKKPKKSIRKVSLKMVTELQKYRFIRAEYLARYPKCQAKLEGCTKGSTQIHHQKGRIGDLLTDSTHFLAVCHNCHHWIELHPVEAKEKGFSLQRHSLPQVIE